MIDLIATQVMAVTSLKVNLVISLKLAQDKTKEEINGANNLSRRTGTTDGKSSKTKEDNNNKNLNLKVISSVNVKEVVISLTRTNTSSSHLNSSNNNVNHKAMEMPHPKRCLANVLLLIILLQLVYHQSNCMLHPVAVPKFNLCETS